MTRGGGELHGDGADEPLFDRSNGVSVCLVSSSDRLCSSPIEFLLRIPFLIFPVPIDVIESDEI